MSNFKNVDWAIARQLWEEQKPVAEIARDLGLHRSTLYKEAKARGWVARPARVPSEDATAEPEDKPAVMENVGKRVRNSLAMECERQVGALSGIELNTPSKLAVASTIHGKLCTSAQSLFGWGNTAAGSGPGTITLELHANPRRVGPEVESRWLARNQPALVIEASAPIVPNPEN